MSLSIAYWNIDGLYSSRSGHRSCKLINHPTAIDLLNYDIICLVETHMSHDDIFHLEGFDVFNNIRPKSKNASRHYGGISVAVKKGIRKGIKFIPPTNSELCWLKLCKSFFNLDDDLFMGFVYITPFTPKNSDLIIGEGVFDLLENDIAKFSKLGQCLIYGDFNAKTNTENDFCLDDNLTATNSFPNYICDSHLPRNNSDSHPVDGYGGKLLALCKSAGIRILNGRTLGDSFGHCTCYSHTGRPSLIDYALASVNILNDVHYLYIHDPGDLSIHCMMSCIITTGAFVKSPLSDLNSGSLSALPPNFIWSDENDSQFQYALQQTISSKGNDFLLCESSSSAANYLKGVLLDAARLARIKTRKSNPNRAKQTRGKKKNKWFDSECTLAKRDLKSAGKLLHDKPFDLKLVSDFRLKRKVFKKLVSKKKTLLKQSLLDKLDNLNDRNPQAFWKIFDQLRNFEKTRITNSISHKDWLNHFTNLMNDVSDPMVSFESTLDSFIRSNSMSIFNELNYRISIAEISGAIGKLKNKKSCGPDGILNEMLKAGHSLLLPLLEKCFNLILSSGKFPDPWRCSFLTPVHKRGDTSKPENYRGIAVGSNLGKLFCSILNKRLSCFCEKHGIIPDTQVGFKKHSRTSDHILTLKSIIDKYVNKITKKYLFCAFVDFKSAFDSISRRGLIFKLLKLGIGGNFLLCLESIYTDVQYSIKLPTGCTQPFSSSVGVKQGCVLSPILFNIFTSDLPEIFDASCDPIHLNNLNLSCLMFADDLVIFSQSHSGLQNCLDKLGLYCEKWFLTVNLSKTKIMIFNHSGRILRRFSFTFMNNPISIAESYCYLGILFTPSGSFTKACERLCDQAKKATFKLKTWDLRNNIPVALKLFDSLIRPILLYCAEVWGPFYLKNPNPNNFMHLCDQLPQEKIYLKFSRYLLGLNKRSTIAAVRGELGIFPLFTNVLSHAAKYWLKLNSGSSLANSAYTDSISSCTHKFGWAKYIQSIWSNFDLKSVWSNHGTLYPRKILTILKQNICERFLSNWYQYIGISNSGTGKTSPKLRTYKLFKFNFHLEKYLFTIKNLAKRNLLTKLRTSCHDLHIETGRYCRPAMPAELRSCRFCCTNSVEDEKHFLLNCKIFSSLRESLFDSIELLTDSFSELDDDNKLIFLLNYNNGDVRICRLVCNFISDCFDLRKAHPNF